MVVPLDHYAQKLENGVAGGLADNFGDVGIFQKFVTSVGHQAVEKQMSDFLFICFKDCI